MTFEQRQAALSSQKRYQEKNPGKSADRASRWRHENSQRATNNDLTRLYGIDLEGKEALAEAQGWRCAGCVCKFADDLGDACVDHDHAKPRGTGVRGLLCTPCNRALGHAKDDPERLRRLADYVSRDVKPHVDGSRGSAQMGARISTKQTP